MKGYQEIPVFRQCIKILFSFAHPQNKYYLHIISSETQINDLPNPGHNNSWVPMAKSEVEWALQSSNSSALEIHKPKLRYVSLWWMPEAFSQSANVKKARFIFISERHESPLGEGQCSSVSLTWLWASTKVKTDQWPQTLAVVCVWFLISTEIQWCLPSLLFLFHAMHPLTSSC